ncbi:MAG: NAD(P)(+) transhydrogenase (Re/Si-specific) subunit beta [Flavobacteriales bacterium]|nr:NAD(P)(+) transhydrogenase (Re/Si-specific) subunit beta [Flavobacteriales bacterium]
MEYIELLYIVSTILLLIGLRNLSSPATARKGNLIAASGMILAIVVSIFSPLEGNNGNYLYIFGGISVGVLMGLFYSKKVKMTEIPELVSLFNGYGGACTVFISILEILKFNNTTSVGISSTTYTALFVGSIAFTGSLVAYGKLSGTVKDWRSSLSSYFNLFWVVLCIGLILFQILNPELYPFLPIVILVVSLICGASFVIPIGGADMPVVISLLNALTGVAAALAGIVYYNMVMLLGGILVGSSGAILTLIMCKSMNRSLLNVVVGGFGGASVRAHGKDQGSVNETTVNDTAIILRYANNVMIIPGYGMAVAQAQKTCKELDRILFDKGVNVNYAIHPVAGRMPGHMNVLLAEADVSYSKLIDLEDANNKMSDTDVCLIVGANDVVNPSALDEPASPIYGMPIIEVLNSKNVVVLKRGMSSGYSGIENPLFFHDKTKMLFGDAKDSIEGILREIKSMD